MVVRTESFEYIWQAIPDSVPNGLLGLDFAGVIHGAAKNRAKKCGGKGRNNGSRFNFVGALKGAKRRNGKEAAVASRGDGRFEDGSLVKREGNVVQFAPEALGEASRQATLQQLEELTNPKPGTNINAPVQSSASKRVLQPQDLKGMDSMFDLSEDRAPPSSNVTGDTDAPVASTNDVKSDCRSGPPPSPSSTHIPDYRIIEKSKAGSGCCIEVLLNLPDCNSASDVDLDILCKEIRLGVEGKYKLEIPLPSAIDKEKSRAKWNKHKKQLTLTLPKATQQ